MRLDHDDAASLHKELAWLTKREGFIQRRLVGAPIVDELLRGAQEDSFEKLCHRFVSAIYTLPEEQAQLLLDVFALAPDTAHLPELSQRRELHGQKIDRKIDTVRTREKAALRRLHSKLVSGAYAQAPLVLDVPEMHGGIIYEEISILVVVNDGKWHATYEHYRFGNMAGEIDYVTIGRSHPGIVTPHPKGRFKVSTRAVEGAGWNDHYWHLNKTQTATEPMRDREVYDLSFRLTPPRSETQPSPVTLASRAFHYRALLASIKVTFNGKRPIQLWKFRDASPFARPQAANQYNQTELDENGTATLTMRDVHGGLFHGFGWQWQPD